MIAIVNQIMPLSGQPKRFSFHIDTNEATTRMAPRNTISRWLKALNVSSGCNLRIRGNNLCRRFLNQIICDSSLYTAAFSTLSDPEYKDPETPNTCGDK